MGLSGKGFLEVAAAVAPPSRFWRASPACTLMVAANNCVDTDTNRRGVAAVLSMRQTIHHAGIDWHAITSETAVWIVYILVVIWEFLIAFVLLAAAVAWWRVVAGHPVRDTAVRLASMG